MAAPAADRVALSPEVRGAAMDHSRRSRPVQVLTNGEDVGRSVAW
ncbi:hypothetical protein [Serinicoccus sediminis]|nr:hypothetical protein [Serinicoccus sediminis]